MTAPAPSGGDARRLLLVVGVVALTAGGVAFAMMEGRKESKVNPVAARLAVIPFAAEHGDTVLARLGRDLAASVAATLARVEGVHAVDTALVRALAGDRAVGHDAADSIGRALGASGYVFGEVEAEGARVRVELKLRSTARGGPAAEIVTGGPRNNHALLSDSVTWALLRRLWRGHNMPEPSVSR